MSFSLFLSQILDLPLQSIFVIADKVFGPASLTEAVYEEGVKNVALSSLMGINGSFKTHQFNFIPLKLGYCPLK